MRVWISGNDVKLEHPVILTVDEAVKFAKLILEECATKTETVPIKIRNLRWNEILDNKVKSFYLEGLSARQISIKLFGDVTKTKAIYQRMHKLGLNSKSPETSNRFKKISV